MLDSKSVCTSETKDELVGVLTAISIVSRRLAKRLAETDIDPKGLKDIGINSDEEGMR